MFRLVNLPNQYQTDKLKKGVVGAYTPVNPPNPLWHWLQLGHRGLHRHKPRNLYHPSVHVFTKWKVLGTCWCTDLALCRMFTCLIACCLTSGIWRMEKTDLPKHFREESCRQTSASGHNLKNETTWRLYFLSLTRCCSYTNTKTWWPACRPWLTPCQKKNDVTGVLG